MPTTRNPEYTADALVSSTEAARILRSHPHDPLAWRRLDSLRANGRLKPVYTDSDCWFRESDVLKAARPWDEPENPDPLAMARGVVFACLIGGITLALSAYAAVRWLG